MAGPPDRTAQPRSRLERLRGGDRSAHAGWRAHAGDRLGLRARERLGGGRWVGRRERADDVRREAMPRLYRSLERAGPGVVRDSFRRAALPIRRALVDLARHQMAGAYQRSLDRFGDESLLGVARCEMKGRTDRAIAVRLGGVEGAVARPFRAIRRPRSEEVRPSAMRARPARAIGICRWPC